ncbi:CRISPR-associated endonuclease Cas3'' [Streptomyces sp. NPDC048507]|uniref:CRISPR-associated endonuclease Cas3'' n=1 Tax=Streptomyces sp. NPDC048507 TaxID=3365560 RepID=UPI00370FDB84
MSGPYPVVCHLLDTAAVCGVLWDEVLGEGTRARIGEALGLSVGQARSVVAFWAGLHDLGKITPGFQAQVGEAFARLSADPVYALARGVGDLPVLRHETASHWAVAALLEEAGYPLGRVRPGGRRSLRDAVSHQVAQLLGGHHGLFGGVLEARELASAAAYQPGLGGGGWAEQRRLHFEELRRVTGAVAVPEGGLPAELAVVVWGLVVVSDWLVSQAEVVESLMPAAGWGGSAAEVEGHWRRARDAAPGVVRAAGVGRARFAAEDFVEMFGFGPNPLQRDLVGQLPALVEEGGPGLVLVTAPTGDGKTEAALFAASVLGRAAGCRGLYVALPTMATADAMFPRVGRFARSALTGDRSMALLHSMAWLRPAAEAGLEGTAQVSADKFTAAEAEAWLGGRHRGLLAPLGVGTVDQVLTGVLPVKYGPMRLFGLAEKVLVVDEAHAYGPWMHQLLVRLLEWLGALRAPVVLLSATLTGRSATSLVDAYRRGAGFGDATVVEPCYPGWLFVSAATGAVSRPRQVASGRERTLEVAARPVVWDTAEQGSVRAGGRREALREELAPLADHGGTALVCCTTVAEAQRTFRDLAEAFPGLAASPGGLRLLHARYPARVRQTITAQCEEAYGKPATGPAVCRPASILVATQLVEQSLDLDFDIVISDLAPLAQLLQRAGRCRRHVRGAAGRPAWAAREDAPRLVVLDPLAGQGPGSRPPAAWGRVYDAGLLHRTSLLVADCREGIAVPGDVQRLVDQVYAPDFVDGLEESVRRDLARLDGERQAGESAEAFLADLTAICSPQDVRGDLSALTHREPGVSEELLVTRLGADSGRAVCLYDQGGGVMTLDEAGTMPLPARGLSREDVAEIMSWVVPVPGRWLAAAQGHPQPDGWSKHTVLRDVVLLPMQLAPSSGWACRHAGRTLSIGAAGLEEI